MGGANCEGEMGAETVRQFPFLDAVVSGEADLMFSPDLIQRLRRDESLDDLPGVIVAGGSASHTPTRCGTWTVSQFCGLQRIL